MKALICGVSGQDGAYLAKLLVERGYSVVGTSRDAQMASFDNLRRLGIRQSVDVCSMVLTDFRSVLQTLTRVQPDEIYNLAGQSSVGLSFEQPVEAFESISIGTLNLLEAMRFLRIRSKLYNAGSSETFGDTSTPADEQTPFRPRSPYAAAKAAAYWQVANYREAYSLFACTGILFNHESPLRPRRFVTSKIVHGAWEIANGEKTKLSLGNLDIVRDWGWAPEYVEAMWRMLQRPTPDDFVIATGQSHSLGDFLEAVFSCAGLNWRDHVAIDECLLRPTDLRVGHANPAKAECTLGWTAKARMKDVARLMFDAVAEDRSEKSSRAPS